MVSLGKCCVSPLNMFANVSNALAWRPGFLASNPFNILIALIRSVATLVAVSIGVSNGILQCWGYSWYGPEVQMPPVDGI